MAEIVVAGAGIVGLATAYELTRRGHAVTVLEKEPEIARHQTGRNSGVIHSGLYYTPGSLKAKLGTAGAASMRDFAREHGIPVDICGKLVVATRPDQLAALDQLYDRGQANGVPVRRVEQDEAREFEPYVSCVAGLRVESTGIVDYAGVCRTPGVAVTEAGGRAADRRETFGSAPAGQHIRRPTGGEHRADRFVNCAGLQSDRLARLAGARAGPADRALPRRVLRAQAGVRAPGHRTDLPGAGPDTAVPGRAPDEDDQRRRARRSERGAGPGPRGLLLGRRQPRDVADYSALARAVAAGPRFWKTGIGESAARCPRGGSWPVCASWCPPSPPTVWGRPRRGYGPRRCGGTGPWWTTSRTSGRRARSTCSTLPRRQRRPRSRSDG